MTSIFRSVWKSILLVTLVAGLSGCGSSIKAYKTDLIENVPSPARLHLRLQTGAGAVSVQSLGFANVSGQASSSGGSTSVSGSGVGMANSQQMSGVAQTEMAAQNLEFELGVMGFVMVEDPQKADLVADFSIGTVRYDALVGWIADQAMLEIRSTTTGGVVSSYKAGSRMITPTVGSLVSKIAKEVRKDYSR